jgi:hypothetical protein
MEEKRNGHRVLVGKPEGNRQLGRPWRRWEDLKEFDEKACTGFIWLRIGTKGG